MNNRIIVLLGIVLFAIAIHVEAACDFYNFSDVSAMLPDQGYLAVLDAYDESGFFRGILINDASSYYCIDPYKKLPDSNIGISSTSGMFDSVSISHFPLPRMKYRVEIYANEADVPNCDFESKVEEDNMRNISIGQITTKGGQQAFYFCRETYSGATEVDRETGELINPYDIANSGEDAIYGIDRHLEAYDGIDNFMNAYSEYQKKIDTEGYREVETYEPKADLYLLLDSKALLTITAWARPLDDCIEMFKNLNVTKVYYEESRKNESIRYLLIEGDRLFSEGRFEEAISAYKRVYELQRFMEYGSYNTRHVPKKVIDNIGIALNNLGRYNESLEWFDLNKPRSGQTWNIYGQLLESKNLYDEADYAFRRAGTARNEDAIMKRITHPKGESASEIEALSYALNASAEEYLGSGGGRYIENAVSIRNAVSRQVLLNDPHAVPLAVGLLIHALENNTDRGGSYLYDIQSTLEEIGAPAIDPLIQVLLNENIEPTRRSLAAEALGSIVAYNTELRKLKTDNIDNINTTPIVLALIQNLKRDDCDIDTIAVALGRIGEPAIDPLTAATLEDKDPKFKENVAWILGYLEEARATGGY